MHGKGGEAVSGDRREQRETRRLPAIDWTLLYGNRLSGYGLCGSASPSVVPLGIAEDDRYYLDDYRLGGSVFVRQFPRRIEIVSPGGFPAGIDEQNLLWEQNPRNRRIAEVLGRCGLVERAGQGFDLIFRACIRQSKPLPDFSRTSSHSVWVTLHGEIQDAEPKGATLAELQQVLPALSRNQVQRLFVSCEMPDVFA